MPGLFEIDGEALLNYQPAHSSEICLFGPQQRSCRQKRSESLPPNSRVEAHSTLESACRISRVRSPEDVVVQVFAKTRLQR